MPYEILSRMCFCRNATRFCSAFEATSGELKGYIRGRVLPYLPLHQDFEWMSLTETNASDGALFAYPPLPWIGARFKFDVREKDGSKMLRKTTENRFLCSSGIS